MAIYIFFIEVLILFSLSRELTKEISKVLLWTLRSKKLAMYILALLFLPGTIVHELSHLIFARLLLLRTGKIHLLPKPDGNYITLGSVEVERSDRARLLLVGAGPLIIGILLIFLAIFFTFDSKNLLDPIKNLLVGFIVFEIGNTMFSSRKDMEGAFEVLIIFFLLITVLYIFQIRIPLDILQHTDGKVLMIFEIAAYFFIIPILIDVVFILLAKVIGKIFERV